MVASLAHHEMDILERAIDASGTQWTPEMAKAFLAIKLSPADVARMNELAAKSRSGALEPDEEIEIESYRSAARLLEILKLRARAALKRDNPAEPASA
jgi:hypothetical protein